MSGIFHDLLDQPVLGRSPVVTVTCALTFLRDAMRPLDLSTPYPRLTEFVDRCETGPAFKSAYLPFFTPGGQ